MEFSHEQLLIIAEWLDSGNRYKFLLFFLFVYLFVCFYHIWAFKATGMDAFIRKCVGQK